MRFSPRNGRLMEKLPWGFGGQCPRENFLARFVAYYESCVQDKKLLFWRLGFCMLFFKEKIVLLHFIFFSKNSEIPITLCT